ncbi:MAG TPA: hypothetical protein VF064_07015 [Pyrinomonadaceae bacterium]
MQTGEFVGPQILRVRALLQTRVVLLNLVAARLVVEEESEIRVEVEERAGGEAVELERAAGL